LVVKMAVPNRKGVLVVTETEMTVSANDIEVTKALMEQKRVALYEAGAAVQLSQDKKFLTLYRHDEDGKPTTIVDDYQNVVIEGYASTFGTPEKRDRGGDYVMPGAWDHTLTDFKKNPVI